LGEVGIENAVDEMAGQDIQCVLGGVDVGGFSPVFEGEGRNISDVIVVAVGQQDGLDMALLLKREPGGEPAGVEGHAVVDENGR